MQRAEATGLGIALVAHGALLWALGLARNAPPPLPVPAMDVSFVEEVGPRSTALTDAPVQSAAPELGAPEDAAPAAAGQPIPEPSPRPAPTPSQAQPTPQPAVRSPAQEQARAQRPPARPSGAGRSDAARGRSLAEDLRPIGDDPRPSSARGPSGPVVSDQARAGMDAAIRRALLPCQRQALPAPEAGSIRVRVLVTLQPNGSLADARVLSVANDDPDLRIYEQRMRDLALNVIQQCAPIRGLPAEYYNVPRGWRQFRYVFPER